MPYQQLAFQQPVALLTMPKVENLVGFKKSTIYTLVKEGKFPTPIQVGARRIGFRSDEIDRWIKSRPRVVLAINSEESGEAAQ